MKVYRVIRADEDPSAGLWAKNPAATYTPEGHLLHGSRPGFASQYISATTDLQLARRWAARTGERLVEIDLTKVQAKVIDLSSTTVRNTYLRGVTARNRARAASEVLIEGFVPPEALTLIPP